MKTPLKYATWIQMTQLIENLAFWVIDCLSSHNLRWQRWWLMPLCVKYENGTWLLHQIIVTKTQPVTLFQDSGMMRPLCVPVWSCGANADGEIERQAKKYQMHINDNSTTACRDNDILSSSAVKACLVQAYLNTSIGFTQNIELLYIINIDRTGNF